MRFKIDTRILQVQKNLPPSTHTVNMLNLIMIQKLPRTAIQTSKLPLLCTSSRSIISRSNHWVWPRSGMRRGANPQRWEGQDVHSCTRAGEVWGGQRGWTLREGRAGVGGEDAHHSGGGPGRAVRSSSVRWWGTTMVADDAWGSGEMYERDRGRGRMCGRGVRGGSGCAQMWCESHFLFGPLNRMIGRSGIHVSA